LHFKLAFIGYGTVAQGLTEIILEKKELLEKKYNFSASVVAISDFKKGSVYDENGLDMEKILDFVKNGKKIDEYPSGIKGYDSLKTIKENLQLPILKLLLKQEKMLFLQIKDLLSSKQFIF
jgi:homoserine dehydrogenase